MCDLLILVTLVEGSVTGDGEDTRYDGVGVGEERFVWPFISIPLQSPSSVSVTTIRGAGFLGGGLNIPDRSGERGERL